MTFLQLYGTLLDDRLGTLDRTQRFTTAKRQYYVNEGMRVFNEQTGCYVRRAPIAITDTVAEYDLESTGVVTDGDYLRPSKTSASLRRVGTSTSYAEGPELPFRSEETLNQTRPNWRTETGIPEVWTLRDDGTASYVVLVPTPDIPSGETWTLLWPYVAQPADMTDDTHEPYGNATPRTTLRPYHRAILHYAAAQLEDLRKNYDGVERQMTLFAAVVAKFRADQQRPNGSRIRLAQNYRARLRMRRPLDPVRYP